MSLEHRQHVEKQRHHFSDKGLYSQSCGFYSCGFSSCHVWMWELDHKKRLNAEELKFQNCGAGEKLLRVLWTAKSSSQSILKEINPEYTLEGLMPKLKIQYFGHLMQSANSLKLFIERPWCWERCGWKEEKGAIEDDMVGCHLCLNGHESEQTLWDSERQGSLECGSPWGYKESDMT